MPHQAIIGDAFGPPESYRLGAHDPGLPSAGEVRVAIRAAGVSFVDVLTARGEYQFKPPLPFIPGSEYAGVVEALGEGVTHLAVGDRVLGSALGGIFAEAGVFRAATVRKMPDAFDFAEAAIFPVSYTTAWHALVDRAQLQPGESVLVLGAAGGTGYAAVQLAKHLGARVIASASSPEKRDAALAAGADAVIAAGAADWRNQLKAANSGKPVDIVFDPVGGPSTEPAFRSLGYGGRHLVVGFPAGIPALPTNLALLKSASLIGVHLRHFGLERPDEAAASAAAVMALAEAGMLRPLIAKRYPLDGFAQAMNDAFSGSTAGRIVLEMPG